jgi:hypothetical protein
MNIMQLKSIIILITNRYSRTLRKLSSDIKQAIQSLGLKSLLISNIIFSVVVFWFYHCYQTPQLYKLHIFCEN